MAEEEEPSTGTPLWGAGSSADAVGQQTNEEAPGAAMRRSVSFSSRIDDGHATDGSISPESVAPMVVTRARSSTASAVRPRASARSAKASH